MFINRKFILGVLMVSGVTVKTSVGRTLLSEAPADIRQPEVEIMEDAYGLEAGDMFGSPAELLSGHPQTLKNLI